MTHRIDQYLEGAVERIALTPEERAQVDSLERAIDDTRAFVDARPAPDLTAAVMRRIEQIGPHPARARRTYLARLGASLWTAREVSFQIRPAYGLLAAAVIVAVMVFPPSARAPRTDVPSVVQTSTAPRLFVQFRLQVADASTVQLAGSFSNWQPQHELHQSSPGVWTVTLPLPLGVHDYAFVVDGQRWVSDPYAQAVDDGFGGTNSRIALLPPDEPHS
jgi:hypothetical protein